MALATPEGDLLRVNPVLSTITGYSAAELTGLNYNHLPHSDDLGASLDNLAALKTGGVDHFTLRHRWVRPEGESIWVQSTISSLRDIDGQIKQLALVAMKIDHIKELEDSVTAERRRRDLILELAGDGILGLDSRGRHTFVNPAAARMLGYEVDELVGVGSHETWHHSLADGSPFPEDDCPITGVLREGRSHRGIDETFWRRDGSSFTCEYISTPIVEDGVVNGAVVIFRPTEDREVPG